MTRVVPILLLMCLLIAPPATAETALERGAYLMGGIVACGNCHTPQTPAGPAPGMELAGNPAPLVDNPAFTAYAPNITPDKDTGIGGWTKAELIRAMSPSLELKVQVKTGARMHLESRADRATVYADRLHLTNILHNLVGNAVKYAKDIPEIYIRLLNTENKLSLQVQDNGIGIPKEHQKRVFDKFYRVPTGNVHNVKGFGLGLFYVRKMCREHRWKLRLYSEPGQGTTIEMIMPLYTSDLDQAPSPALPETVSSGQ